MELRMAPYKPAEVPQFNYEELKAAVQESMARYENAVYTDDQIRQAKADKASLNKLRKALNDERIRLEKEYMVPFNTFKGQVNEIIGCIDRPVRLIDEQVRSYDERQKEEKRSKIEAYWDEARAAGKVPDGILFERVFCEKWLNASVTMKTIQEAIGAKLDQINKDLAVIRALPAYAFEAEQEYISTLDLAKAVSEAHRLQEMEERKAAYEAELEKRRAEREAARIQAQAAAAYENRTAEPESNADRLPDEPKREWIAFQAYLTPEEARALGQYMKANGIRYKAV